MYRYIFIFISIFIIKQNIFAQDIITLSNFNSFKTKIEAVHSWGLLLSSQKSINYKVIKNLKTQNYNIIEKINEFLPELKPVLLQDSVYFLDFKNYVGVQKNYEIDSLKYKAALIVMYSTTISENFELQLRYVPGFTKLLFLEIGFTSGSYSGIKDFPGFNKSKIKYETFAFNLGLGFIAKIAEHNFFIGYNYSAKSINYMGENIESNAGRVNNSFLSTGFNFRAAKKYHILIGFRYHWPPIDLYPAHSKFTIHFGFGISL